MAYPTQLPTAPGSVLGAEDPGSVLGAEDTGSVLGAEDRVRNRRRKRSWAHELSGAHRRDIGPGTLDAPGQRLGQQWWEELDISRQSVDSVRKGLPCNL